MIVDRQCGKWITLSEAGKNAQVELAKDKNFIGCVRPATDLVEKQMEHVKSTAAGTDMAPLELWCTTASAMYSSSEETQRWIEIMPEEK